MLVVSDNQLLTLAIARSPGALAKHWVDLSLNCQHVRGNWIPLLVKQCTTTPARAGCIYHHLIQPQIELRVVGRT